MLLNTVPAPNLMALHPNLQYLLNNLNMSTFPNGQHLQEYQPQQILSLPQSLAQIPDFVQGSQPTHSNNTTTPAMDVLDGMTSRRIGQPQVAPGNATGAMSKHSLDSAPQKAHVCADCGRGFTLLGSLRNHVKGHIRVTPYVCTDCGKGFNHQSSLVNHQRTHALSKTKTCTQCGRAFKLAYHLRRHMMTHTGEKHHACSVCAKAFGRADHLQKHMTIHGSAKPYVCPYCQYMCARHDALKTHMMTHNKAKKLPKYVCSVCGETFSRKNVLASHMRQHMANGYMQVEAKPKSLQKAGRKRLLGWDESVEKKSFLLDEEAEHLFWFGSTMPKVDDQDIDDDCYVVDDPDQSMLSDTQLGSTEQEDCYVVDSPEQKSYSKWDVTGVDLSCMWDNTDKKSLMKEEAEQELTTDIRRRQMSYTCCGEEFHHLCDLDTHTRSHRVEKRHMCVNCGEVFRELLDLKTHIESHTEDSLVMHSTDTDMRGPNVENQKAKCARSPSLRKRHTCSNCGKKFRRLVHLRRHKKTHRSTVDAGKVGMAIMPRSTEISATLSQVDYIQGYSQCGMCVNGFVELKDLQVHLSLHQLLNW